MDGIDMQMAMTRKHNMWPFSLSSTIVSSSKADYFLLTPTYPIVKTISKPITWNCSREIYC